jgi:hypothetical protein
VDHSHGFDGADSGAATPPAVNLIGNGAFNSWQMNLLLFCQIGLLVYHQITTIVDFYPFNSVRNYTWKMRLGEAGFNGVLMSLAPIGFGFHIRGLMIFGVIYYSVLFIVELIIWWVPYLTVPTGCWRVFYNHLLGAVMFTSPKEDAMALWLDGYNRVFRETVKVLPSRGDRPVPNLEHTILHAWTLITAILTIGVFFLW